MQQQAMLQQQQQQQQQEEYMRQQYMLQQQQQQALMAQPTGYRSNNPFAPSSSFLSPQNNPGASNSNGGSLFGSSPGQQESFLPVPTVVQQQQPEPQQQQQPQQPQQPPQPAKTFAPKKDDGQHAGLAALMARGREDGLDTFGNVGNLRTSSFSSTARTATGPHCPQKCHPA